MDLDFLFYQAALSQTAVSSPSILPQLIIFIILTISILVDLEKPFVAVGATEFCYK